MTDTPLVSVLMPVYNGEPYLREAVESILNQTFADFEFIIIDDGSTDSTWQILTTYAAQDPRIVLIRSEENVGLTKSLNKGLALARGKYIARQDADDVSLPQRLEKQMLYVVQHPQVVLLGTWCQSINEVGNQSGCFHPPTTHQAILDYFAAQNPFAHSSVLFRRAPVQEIGGYPVDYLYAQDLSLWFQLSCQYPVANLSEELAQIRIHPGQTGRSADMRTVKRWEALRVYRQAQAHPGLSPQARKAGRRTVARAMLDFAEALSQEGRRGAALRWVGRVCLQYPHLCAQDTRLRMRIIQVLGVLMGPRGRKLWRSAKKRLHYVRPAAWSSDNQ